MREFHRAVAPCMERMVELIRRRLPVAHIMEFTDPDDAP
jgi:hypothetical protein